MPQLYASPRASLLPDSTQHGREAGSQSSCHSRGQPGLCKEGRVGGQSLYAYGRGLVQ